AETLLDAVRVPGQVVVDYQMRPLQVNALPGSVGGNQDHAGGIVGEALLGDAALLAVHAAVDLHYGLGPAEETAEAIGQVVKRVAVLAEQQQLVTLACSIEELG